MTSRNNPISFRQKRHNITDSLWHAQYNYSSVLHDDIIIREIIKYTYQKQNIWVNQIIIRRTFKSFYIIVYLYGLKPGRWVSVKKKKIQKTIKNKKKKKKKLFRYIYNNFEERIQKMIRQYCNIQDQQIYLMTYDYKKIYNFQERHIKNIKNSFRYFKFFESYNSIIELAYISLQTQNTTAFCTCVAEELQSLKRHKPIISFIRDLFKRYSIRFKFFVGFRVMLKGRLNGRPRGKTMYFQQGFLPLQTIMANVSYHLMAICSKYGTFGLHIWLCFSNSNIYQVHFLNHLRRNKKDRFNNFLEKLPISYTFTSVPNFTKTVSFTKVYPFLYEDCQHPYFNSKAHVTILKMAFSNTVYFNDRFKQREFLIWNFLNHFFLKKHKKYEPIFFLQILNYLMMHQENQYCFLMFKKSLIFSLFFKKNQKKGKSKKRVKKKTC